MDELVNKLLGLLRSQQAQDAGITSAEIDDSDSEEEDTITLVHDGEEFILTID